MQDFFVAFAPLRKVAGNDDNKRLCAPQLVRRTP
jgi:hypothetical protein